MTTLDILAILCLALLGGAAAVIFVGGAWAVALLIWFWPIGLFVLAVCLAAISIVIFVAFHRFPRLTSIVFVVGFIGATATFYLANMPEPLEPPSTIEIEKAKAVAQKAARIVAYADWLVLHCEPSFVVNPSVSTGWTMYAEAEAGFAQDFFDNELAIQKALVGELDTDFEGCKSAADVLPTGTVSER